MILIVFISPRDVWDWDQKNLGLVHLYSLLKYKISKSSSTDALYEINPPVYF